MVDPAARLLEVVTGSVVRRSLPDDAVRLAVAGMESAFAGGDLVGGIRPASASSRRLPASRHPARVGSAQASAFASFACPAR